VFDRLIKLLAAPKTLASSFAEDQEIAMLTTTAHAISKVNKWSFALKIRTDERTIGYRNPKCVSTIPAEVGNYVVCEWLEYNSRSHVGYSIDWIDFVYKYVQ
jgi:hypothetical protein